MSACLCHAGCGGLIPAIDILLVNLRLFGERSFVNLKFLLELCNFLKCFPAKWTQILQLALDCK